MSFPAFQGSFNAGELSPELYGRVDLKKYRDGCSTMRNMFAGYRGGAYSRAGTKFIGQCLQSGTALPPVLIPFQFNATQGYVIEAGENYFRFVFNGGYVTESPQAITAVTLANPGVFTIVGHGYLTDDWVQIAGLTDMPRIDGQIYKVVRLSADTFSLKRTLTGADVSTVGMTAYVSGATAARIYTVVTPYAAADLPALKWTQSADVMSLTHPSYPPADLARVGAASWTLTVTDFGTSIAAPGAISSVASNTTTSNPTQYQYVVTAVDAVTGEESIASPITTITNSVDIAVVAGTNTVTWSPVTGASSYNIYRAPPAYSSTVPPGSLFSYAGTSLGLSFNDTNIVTDATHVPPVHQNPFATSSITGISMSDFGSGIDTVTYAIAGGGPGSGFAATPVVVGGELQWWIIENGGEGYTAGNTLAITATYTTTSSTSPSGTLILGPTTGTYPSCVAYFQQRRFYANTNNNPDTYFASQPGAFDNMDSAIPTKDDDAIIGAPWSQQVDGIQALVPMPGGLVILTGRGAWQLSGGVQQSAITPSNQFATPQAYNGCSPLIRPLTINYDVLYVQEKGSVVRDLSYNFFVNIYTGTDMTVLSNHLFNGYLINRWDWAEEPFKIVWAVRNDGVLLALTYLKEQEVYAWSRHDTNGLFQSVACISEPPVNAPYFVVKRLIQTGGSGVWAYYLERMDNRTWDEVEQTWCVDSGLSYPMTAPEATLTAASATGSANITSYNLVFGGSGYTAPTGILIDPLNAGSGASVSFTVVGGVITAATAVTTGVNYSQGTQLRITDSTGSGAVVQPVVTNHTTFEASSAVFGSAQAGDVIRIGGGRGVVVSVPDSQHVVVDIVEDITEVIPNNPENTPVPAVSGSWTITRPTATVYGLDHLEGMTVSILADGNVVDPIVVENGSITMPAAATAIVVGLPFMAQLQTLYLEMPANFTVQTRKKNLYYVTARVYKSRGWWIGANQPDASVQPDGENIPWTNLVQVQERGPQFPPGVHIPLQTGDFQTPILSEWGTNGQVALQQSDPLPLNIMALVPWLSMGDDPSVD